MPDGPTAQRRPLTLEQAFSLAVERHRAGDLAAAQGLYRQILAAAPGHAPSHQHLGALALQRGDTAEAVTYFARALACDPAQAEAWINLATALRRLGRPAEAATAARRAVRLQPMLAEAWVTLGNLEDGAAAHSSAAQAAWRTAVAVQPALATALMRLGAAGPARRVWLERAARIDPGHLDTLVNLAAALHEEGSNPAAEAVARRAAALAPHSDAAWNNLGNSERYQDRPAEALHHYRRAVMLAAGVAGYHHNCGAAWENLDSPDEAAAAHRRALCLAPGMAAAWRSLASLRRAAGHSAEAIAAARRAVALAPDVTDHALTLAFCLLAAGRFAEGWTVYEARRRHAILRKSALDGPCWDGGPLAGRRLLVQCEQGLGDTLQFCRLVPGLAGRADSVTLRAPTTLLPLLDSLGVALADDTAPPPPHDLWVPLLSLPRLLAIDADTIPAAESYLRPPAERLAQWRQRLARLPRPRVGLVWAGNPGYSHDRRRSLPVSRLEPLLAADACFVSLQKGAAVDELAARSWPIESTIAQDLEDFADTAAVVADLDLVITVDTAVAHLAGALGRPVWIMLPFEADWRWLSGGESSPQGSPQGSPWYPSARLFRQRRAGDWDEVVARMSAALDVSLGER